jgi:hypothetical protein
MQQVFTIYENIFQRNAASRIVNARAIEEWQKNG